ncbi:MAG: hypothetical protein R3F59_21910 [Myxococcota bacterium]
MPDLPAAGLVDLRDLWTYPWSPHALPRACAVARIPDGGRIVHRIAPPDRLVVVASIAAPEAVEQAAAWLATAATVLLVRDLADDLDPALRPLLDEAWAAAAARLGNVAATFDWHPDEPASLLVALDHALDLHTVPRRRPRPPEAPEHPAGPWVAVAARLDRDLVVPRLFATATGAGLVTCDAPFTSIDLADPPEAPPVLGGLASAVGARGRLTPDGAWVEAQRTALPVPSRLRGRTGIRPVGVDPVHPLATAGWRCTFDWLFVGEGGAAWLAVSAHDWPCGHAKKLWGFEDNHPVAVAVAPDASAYVATFGHDALVSADVPLRWRVVGDLAVADWPPPSGSDPLRALLFCTDDSGWPGDPLDPQDDDHRAFAPAVVLGPDDACRYAVALDAPTYRIRGEHSERIDGEGGYGVYDRDHALVRRGEGRLLGGWFQHATVAHRGRLWREDLATGERRDLGAEARPVAWAAAVPGTRNVVLAAEDPPALRLV